MPVTHADSNTDRHAECDTDSDGSTYTYTYTYSDAHCLPNSNRDSHCNPYFDTDALRYWHHPKRWI
jgi:hypothetical protein